MKNDVVVMGAGSIPARAIAVAPSDCGKTATPALWRWIERLWAKSWVGYSCNYKVSQVIKLTELGVATLVTTVLLPANADTVSWVGGTGDWNTVANWSTGALPGPNDDVVISPASSSITVTHSSGTHTVKTLTSQRAFQLTGGLLTVSNTVQVNNTFTLAGGVLVNATVLAATNGASFIVNGSGTLDGVTVGC